MDKPVLLQALELILASPEEIQKETENLKNKFYGKYANTKSGPAIEELIAKKIISNYSYYSAFVGGASGLAGVVPGVGTAVSVAGGTLADVAYSMKYQVEMMMSLAHLYGHNIQLEEEKRLCMIIAGLGALNQAAQKKGKAVASKAFVKMAHQYLKGSTLVAVKEIFKRVGIVFTRKALVKAIPVGVGCVAGILINKGLTKHVGQKGVDFFSA